MRRANKMLDMVLGWVHRNMAADRRVGALTVFSGIFLTVAVPLGVDSPVYAWWEMLPGPLAITALGVFVLIRCPECPHEDDEESGHGDA